MFRGETSSRSRKILEDEVLWPLKTKMDKLKADLETINYEIGAKEKIL